ncbi:MAG: cytochrome c [FCB group bacterium]|jgi:mono/diheme cytochrome c family protein|nr:cytochrome c [FCB group bacterium]
MPLRNARRTRAVLAVFALCAIMASGCDKLMHDQPRYKPFRPSAFFADGMSARPAVAGTIAQGTLHDGDPVFTGEQDGQLVPVMPVPLTPELLKRGQERFNVYCAPCHGATGEGNGMIVRRGFPAPPSYHIDRLRSAPDGHFFSVITNGFGRMYEYGTRVPVADRWAIIAYIRALQVSQHATLADVPADEQAKLNTGTAQ